MGFKSGIAKVASGVLTWGLRNVAHRPAAQLPGRVALEIDPDVVRELRTKMRDGSIVVVGTNGKTTVTNLLADVLIESGRSVLCNRTGANLKAGIATALLQGDPSEWGVIECDELWLAHVVPDLRPTWVLLLNLFRDQLDRCGEIDRIQESIAGALASSPNTGLIYNADDPLCEYVARRVCELRGSEGTGRFVAFGLGESMHLAQNVVADATMCQTCSHMFEYAYRQYGQLGAYHCDNCGFGRPDLDFVGSNIDLRPDGLSFDVTDNDLESPASATTFRLSAHLSGTYNVYNLLAVYSAATTIDCTPSDVQDAINRFNPRNGRLERYIIDGRNVLLNLAKNPTGFNQNLRIVSTDSEPHAVAFFINDQVVDGHDISWIWDIDFEELADQLKVQPNIKVFAGGSRKNDLQVRLKYAGIKAQLIDEIGDVFKSVDALSQRGEFPVDAAVYAIANYSALPPVKHALDAMSKGNSPVLESVADEPSESELDVSKSPSGGLEVNEEKASFSNGLQDKSVDSVSAGSPVVIAHILPDLLNLYGDGGNVRILKQRLAWRGIPVEVRSIRYGDAIEFDDVDLVFLGGGPDREQKLATEQLASPEVRDALEGFISDGGPVLAICGGYQILGRTWLLGDEEVPGLGLLGFETRRPGTSADRLIGNIVLTTELSESPVVGFENHAGRTYLDEGVRPLGLIAGHAGKGNNDDPAIAPADGVVSGSVIGTYLHGPFLSKNPEIADWLLERAVEHHSARTGEVTPVLFPLPDEEEKAANAFMASKLI